MLTLLAYGMVTTFMVLIMTRRMPPLTALVLVPAAFGMAAGYTRQLGPMMLEGMAKLAPTGIMLLFAILYFAVMIEAGLFEPFVRRVVAVVRGDPVRIVVGSAAVALLVSLDGDGSTTYMITTAAMLPLYRRAGVRPLVLACVTMLAGGVMNILPWGGPTARAATALGIDAADIFVPLVPAMAIGSAWVLLVAWHLGRRERERLAQAGPPAPAAPGAGAPGDPQVREDDRPRRPGRLPLNAALTALLMTALVLGVMPLPVLFMLGFAVAITLNCPGPGEQRAFVARHAANALAVAGLIFAAGAFTGILAGTKMVDAMATSVVALVPDALAPYLATLTGLLSLPFTFFISNDAFYYGVLPILARAAQAHGITAAELGRASVTGQPLHLLSPLVPSTYLLVGLCGIEFGDHQRFTIPWAIATSLVLLAAALLTGVIPLAG